MTDRRNFVQATLADNLVETTSDLGDEGEDDDLDSCSSFSLQQCIDEFRARRIRRNSAHTCEQREETNENNSNHNNNKQNTAAKANEAPIDDADLISQNRSNKEHERKCKPCKNGFCYCFTSDSGDGGGGGGRNGCAGFSTSANAARGGLAYNMRNARRSRKSESGQATAHIPPQRCKERRSAPASLKTNTANVTTATKVLRESKPKRPLTQQTTVSNNKRALTAISRLETTSTDDAPMIQIVQELRDNCVISEVRVNKHKLDKSKIGHAKLKSPKLKEMEKVCNKASTTPPPIDMSSKTIKTLSGESIPVGLLELNLKSSKPKRPGAGRLLQKRLSVTNLQYKPRDITEPPPKPPRASTGSYMMTSNSSLSTTSSVREAERIVDEFLIKNGVPLPTSPHKIVKSTAPNSRTKRKSFPLAHMDAPTCPSLSDIEAEVPPREVYTKDTPQKQSEPIIKDITIGWQEPKLNEMLNYDTNGNCKQFKSQSTQAEPQTIGWQIPPKLSLDTVDGSVRQNLASSLATKDTPIKRQFQAGRKNSYQTPNYKFGWSWPSAPKCPRSFLKHSKKKILKLVTPKKDNKPPTKFHPRKTPHRNVAIQTTLQDFAQLSPPGSYHSAAVQTSNDVTPQSSQATTNSQNNNHTSDSAHFDFTRKVNSPPRRKQTATGGTEPRSTQRKLDFQPSNVCSGSRAGFCCNQASTADSAPSFGSVHRQTAGGRTYRSYQKDLDQDVTLSKMGVILSNIRARLEASDEHAIRTFEEIERREQQQQQQLTGFDCPDSLGIRQRTDYVDLHTLNFNKNRNHTNEPNEPIYSEIEEDSIHVTESPQYDNKTGIESSPSSASVAHAIITTAIDFDTLYAKVNKPTAKSVQNNPNKANSYKPLGQFLTDSLKKKQSEQTRLSVVMEPSISDDVSYSSPPLESTTTTSQHTRYDSPTPSAMSHGQSLNNIRVMEQHSPPKRTRNLSKSDLSLHRSEIFLDNLCRNELIVENDGTMERLEKVENRLSNRTFDAEAISYDVPIEVSDYDEAVPTQSAQTPQKYITKPAVDYVNIDQFSVGLPALNYGNYGTRSKNTQSHTQRISQSCPTTPQKFQNSQTATDFDLTLKNFNDLQNELLNSTVTSTIQTANEPISSLTRYKRLKQALQKSFRKSKNFVKYRRASLPVTTTTTITTTTTGTTNIDAIEQSPNTMSTEILTTSYLNIDELFEIDEAVSVTEQIARAVGICRQIPALESSREMVEAERLLLYSKLRREICQLNTSACIKKDTPLHERHFTVETLRLPVANLETNFAGYFNYYFTITFECDGQIRSTQSTEYRHGEVVFQNCDFKFATHKSSVQDAFEPSINCNIFILRLRKISNTNGSNDVLPSHDITPLTSTPESSASSLDGITSRFRFFASFRLNAHCFKPFTLSPNQAAHHEFITLNASNHCHIPLKLSTTAQSTTTSAEKSIVLIGKAQINFPQFSFQGFLHVQDPFSLHNWNWRWCTLHGLQLDIWPDESTLSATPLMSLNLKKAAVQVLPLTACSRELCARVRSFCLQCATTKIDADVATAAVFFAADRDADLEQWLAILNLVLNFIVEWMQ